MAHHHGQPRHAHATPVRLIDNRHTTQQANIVRVLFLNGFQEVVINFKDNLQVARQDLTKHINRPGFQRFAHQRVVGVGEHLAGHLERFIP